MESTSLDFNTGKNLTGDELDRMETLGQESNYIIIA